MVFSWPIGRQTPLVSGMADSPKRQETVLEIVNQLGLHARAAARFVEVASRFEAEIDVLHSGHQANGKSIMSLMMLAAARGSRLAVTATGDDADDALQALAELVGNRFGEAD